MNHELRGRGCACGYRWYHADRSLERKMMDLHFRSRHDLYEHVEIIKQLVGETAEHPNANQGVALAILHLVECLEEFNLHCIDSFLHED